MSRRYRIGSILSFLLLIGAASPDGAGDRLLDQAGGPEKAGSILSEENRVLELETPRATLTQLVYREQIRDLISLYAHRVAQGYPVADLFTDDGVYIRRVTGEPIQVIRGRRALNDHFAEGRPVGSAMPMIHNLLIEVTRSEATAMSSIELRIAQGRDSIIASGYYQDRLRRSADGKWKFLQRNVTFFHWARIQDGWVGKADNNR